MIQIILYLLVVVVCLLYGLFQIHYTYGGWDKYWELHQHTYCTSPGADKIMFYVVQSCVWPLTLAVVLVYVGSCKSWEYINWLMAYLAREVKKYKIY